MPTFKKKGIECVKKKTSLDLEQKLQNFVGFEGSFQTLRVLLLN